MRATLLALSLCAPARAADRAMPALPSALTPLVPMTAMSAVLPAPSVAPALPALQTAAQTSAPLIQAPESAPLSVQTQTAGKPFDASAAKPGGPDPVAAPSSPAPEPTLPKPSVRITSSEPAPQPPQPDSQLAEARRLVGLSLAQFLIVGASAAYIHNGASVLAAFFIGALAVGSSIAYIGIYDETQNWKYSTPAFVITLLGVAVSLLSVLGGALLILGAAYRLAFA